MPLSSGFIDSLDPHDPRGVVLTGRHGFTVRLDGPVAAWLANAGGARVPVEFLLPKVAWRALAPEMPFHLLVGKTAVAKRVAGAPRRGLTAARRKAMGPRLRGDDDFWRGDDESWHSREGANPRPRPPVIPAQAGIQRFGP